MCAVAHWFFDALGGARPHSFLLLVQKKRTKEKDTRRLAPCYRKRFPALLALSGARELAGYARSDMHALLPETAAMLGGVNGTAGAPIRL
ncbi:MAG: hypothetical protein WBM71_16805 [Sedimenticolaceae bacterium]